MFSISSNIISGLILLCIYRINPSLAFQQARYPVSYFTSQDVCNISKLRLGYGNNNIDCNNKNIRLGYGNNNIDCNNKNNNDKDIESLSRRDILNRIVPTGITLAISSSVDGRANALDTPKSTNMPTPSKKLGGLPNKIRSVSKIMDELQRDLMQERWELIQQYPNQLRSYVPVFTSYTDSAFPSDNPTDKGLRVALRYEVGRFYGSLERFRQAISRKGLDEAYVAYSDMSLHFDRYLRVGGMYTFYDDNISLEDYYSGVSEQQLVYADPKKDPALVRDLIVLIKGPEKGRTGIVIGIYPDDSKNCAVKLDRSRGIREIRVVPRLWAAKRLGEQDPDDVFLLPQSA